MADRTIQLGAVRASMDTVAEGGRGIAVAILAGDPWKLFCVGDVLDARMAVSALKRAVHRGVQLGSIDEH